MKSIIALMIMASLFAGVISFIPNQASCTATETKAPSTSHGQNTDDAQSSCKLNGHVAMNLSGTCFLCIDMLLPDQGRQQNEASAVAIVDPTNTLPLRILVLPWQPPA